MGWNPSNKGPEASPEEQDEKDSVFDSIGLALRPSPTKVVPGRLRLSRSCPSSINHLTSRKLNHKSPPSIFAMGRRSSGTLLLRDPIKPQINWSLQNRSLSPNL
jgi:hypothetical protein